MNLRSFKTDTPEGMAESLLWMEEHNALAATGRDFACWESNANGGHCTRPAAHAGVHAGHQWWSTRVHVKDNYVRHYWVRSL